MTPGDPARVIGWSPPHGVLVVKFPGGTTFGFTLPLSVAIITRVTLFPEEEIANNVLHTKLYKIKVDLSPSATALNLVLHEMAYMNETGNVS